MGGLANPPSLESDNPAFTTKRQHTGMQYDEAVTSAIDVRIESSLQCELEAATRRRMPLEGEESGGWLSKMQRRSTSSVKATVAAENAPREASRGVLR